MDVCCEKCGTEYELDERRLKPGGVTVKCTTCGHLFKVRRRIQTVVGMPTQSELTDCSASPGGPQTMRSGSPSGSQAPARTAAPAAVAPEGERSGSHRIQRSSNPVPESIASHSDASGPFSADTSEASGDALGEATKERIWLIRLPSGEIETCRELATLQQWIVSGKVTRSSGISRTGRTWKKLGEIGELASYFQIADEARQARSERSVAQALPPAGAPAARPVPTPTPGPPAPGSHEPVQEQNVQRPEPAPMREPAQRAVPEVAKSAQWSPGNLRDAGKHAGPSGPMSGIARGATGQDVAFIGGKIKPIKDAFSGSEAEAADLDDDLASYGRRGVGRWIVAASLVLIAGAAAVVYVFVFRDSGAATSMGGDSGAAVPAIDAGMQVAHTTPDAAAPAVTEPADVGAAEVIAAAQEAIARDSRASLEAVQGQLASQPGADAEAPVLATRARVSAALAQHLFDEAGYAERKQAKELSRQAEQAVLEAMNLAKKALQKDGTTTTATVVMADVLRLQGKRSRDVERYLQKVLKSDSRNRDALLVRALALAGDKQERKGRQILIDLEKAAKGEDSRPSYRLALMDFGAKSYADSKRRAEEVLAMSPEHRGATLLLGRIREALAVDTSDPMPPEEGSIGSDSSRSDDSYESLVARAYGKAEKGHCNEAMGIYERALDINPSGVDALTGMGYCHVEERDFSSAYAKFNAALGVSPRYQDALWGVAEAYQQQGLNSRAIEAYKRFVDEHPNSSRAATAKKQIERLGGSSDPENPPGNGTGTDGSSGTGGSSGAGSASSQPTGSSTDKPAGNTGGSEGGAVEPAENVPNPPAPAPSGGEGESN